MTTEHALEGPPSPFVHDRVQRLAVVSRVLLCGDHRRPVELLFRALTIRLTIFGSSWTKKSSITPQFWSMKTCRMSLPISSSMLGKAHWIAQFRHVLGTASATQ